MKPKFTANIPTKKSFGVVDNCNGPKAFAPGDPQPPQAVVKTCDAPSHLTSQASCLETPYRVSAIKDVITPACPPLPPWPPPSNPDSPEDWDYSDPEVCSFRDQAPVPSHRLKRVHSTRVNFWAMLKRHRHGHALFLTLTLPDEGEGKPDSLDAARRLLEAEPVLDRIFTEWMLVMEFHPDSGLPHFHGIGIARQRIASGWHPQPLQEIRKLKQLARREKRSLAADENDLIRSWSKVMRPNPQLREIWRILATELPAHGFGHAQATPLEDAKSVLRYIVKDAGKVISESKDGAASDPARPRYRRGSRLFFHSESFKVVCNTDFSWNSAKTRRDRLRKTRIANALRLSPEKCMSLFGRAWNQRMNRLVGELNRRDRDWPSGTDVEVENTIIETLTSLPPVSRGIPALNPSETLEVPRWAKDLAETLWERRHRYRNGLPEEPEPLTHITVIDDLRRIQNLRP